LDLAFAHVARTLPSTSSGQALSAAFAGRHGEAMPKERFVGGHGFSRAKKAGKDPRSAESAAPSIHFSGQIESPDEIGALFKLNRVRQLQS